MQTAGPRPPDASLTFPYRKLFCGARAAFRRGAEGSIASFLQRGELTHEVSPNCLLGRKNDRDVVDSVAIPIFSAGIRGSLVSAKTELRHH